MTKPVVVFSTLFLFACSDGNWRAETRNEPASSDARGAALFPLAPGTTWEYVGFEEGVPLYEEVEVLDPILWGDASGAPTCLPVRQRRFVGGNLVEITTEWFAADAHGAIWQFGEETWELVGNRFDPGADNWRAGEDAAEPVLFLPDAPTVGQTILQHKPTGIEVLRFDSLSASIETPAGRFDGCTEVTENPDTDDQDIILFAPGTGIVALTGRTSRKVLVRASAPR